MSNCNAVKTSVQSELIYQLEDKPPFAKATFAAIQHLLAMIVAVITPAMLISQALHLPLEDSRRLISMSLFASGIASLLQIKTWGPIGSGLLSIQGTSFNFVSPIILGGTALQKAGASTPCMLASLFGTLMLASITEMILSRILPMVRRVITPLVTGIVVMIIGLSLIQVGLNSIGGGEAAIQNHRFGAPQNLLLAAAVLLVIVLLNRQKNPYLRVSSLMIAMAYGLAIDWQLLLPFVMVFMVTSLETIGDITATSDVSGQPVSGPLYIKRLKAGVLANGINSSLSALLNTFPNSCFGQNNGVIQLTGVASRYVGFLVAIMLIILGIFPACSMVMQLIPAPVLGAATLVMFGTIAASGVRILAKEVMNRRTIMILAISLAMGLGVAQQPQILHFFPDWIKTLCASGIAVGAITAILLNFIFPYD
jgi:xanthine permease XanP